MNKYNKLVRDKIPKIIISKGEKPITRILTEVEYKKELEKKLLEECNEVINALESTERAEELADCLEVITALAKIEGKNLEDIIMIANDKNIKRGSFDNRIFLETVEK